MEFKRLRPARPSDIPVPGMSVYRPTGAQRFDLWTIDRVEFRSEDMTPFEVSVWGRYEGDPPPFSNRITVYFTTDRGSSLSANVSSAYPSNLGKWVLDDWWVEDDAEGTQQPVYERIGTAVTVQVFLPDLDPAEAERKVREAISLLDSIDEPSVWGTQGVTDHRIHVFDHDGWPLAESVLSNTVGRYMSQSQNTVTTVEAAVPMKDAHAMILKQKAESERNLRASAAAVTRSVRKTKSA